MSTNLGFATIKLSKNSVMLYENGYRKATPDSPAGNYQTYRCSFSTKETTVPNEFMAELNHLTAEKPARCAELLARSEERVFVPRRAAIEAENADCAKRLSIVALDRSLSGLREFSQSVSQGTVKIDQTARQTLIALRQELNELSGSPGATLAPDEPTVETADQRICRLVRVLNQTNAELQICASELPRGWPGSDETVRQWQAYWYSNRDMFDKVKVRKGFSRPGGWTNQSIEARVASGEIVD